MAKKKRKRKKKHLRKELIWWMTLISFITGMITWTIATITTIVKLFT